MEKSKVCLKFLKGQHANALQTNTDFLETFNTLVREMKKAGNSENPEASDVHKKVKEFALLVNSTN
jgi:hypothetical protein